MASVQNPAVVWVHLWCSQASGVYSWIPDNGWEAATDGCRIRACFWSDGLVPAGPRELQRESGLLDFPSRLYLLICCCVLSWPFSQPSFFLRAALRSCFLVFPGLGELWSRGSCTCFLCVTESQAREPRGSRVCLVWPPAAVIRALSRVRSSPESSPSM